MIIRSISTETKNEGQVNQMFFIFNTSIQFQKKERIQFLQLPKLLKNTISCINKVVGVKTKESISK